jgi:hypothetical protein
MEKLKNSDGEVEIISKKRVHKGTYQNYEIFKYKTKTGEIKV